MYSNFRDWPLKGTPFTHGGGVFYACVMFCFLLLGMNGNMKVAISCSDVHGWLHASVCIAKWYVD